MTVFFSTIQGTDIQAADYNVPRTVTPYVSVFDRLNSAGIRAAMLSPFTEPYPTDFSALCDAVRAYCRRPGKQYIYAYWNQPDGLMHRLGCAADPVHEAIREMETAIEKLAGDLEDTLVIVTADHGHIDTDLKKSSTGCSVISSCCFLWRKSSRGSFSEPGNPIRNSGECWEIISPLPWTT